MANILKKNKSIARIIGIPALILLIPLVAMQFSSDVMWGTEDFLVMGVLLVGVVSLIELVLAKVRNRNQRILLVLVILALFLWIWVELAVGLFTNIGS